MAFAPFGAMREPHGMGHYLAFQGIGTPQAPVIAVELEK